MEKNRPLTTRKVVTVAALIACGLSLTCVSGQDETPGKAAQPNIILADPNKQLAQLELFRVEELFAIAAEVEDGYIYLKCYEDKSNFLYGAWGRTAGNVLIHLGAQFPYACMIPRYNAYFENKERLPANWDDTAMSFPLLYIDSKHAMETVVEAAVSTFDEKSYSSEWYHACVILGKAGCWNEKYSPFEPGGLRPAVWWDRVKDSWPGHPLYRAMEEALQVFLDKSRPEKEREKAGDFVRGAVSYLPLAGVLPYVEPVARDTSEPYWLRKKALLVVSRLRVNDTIPVFIDLLTDISEGEPYTSFVGVTKTIADSAYGALVTKTGVGNLYRLAIADDGVPRYLSHVDKIDLPLKVQEILALDLCPCGRPAGDSVLGWKPISMISESERLRLQQNWRYFWEKMKGWILVQ